MNDSTRGPDCLSKFSVWVRNFLVAVADARIPPGRMRVVPNQGIMNSMTAGLGVILYTAAAHGTALNRNLSLISELFLATIGAALLFVAAIVVLFFARGTDEILREWNKTTSVFICVWLLALVVFIILYYPLALITNDIILIDKLAYRLNSLLFSTDRAWRDDLTKSFICTFLAGLFLIYRSNRVDPSLSLKTLEPWLWLVMMTLIVGVVFDISLFVAF
jgi:hypothetical protein